MINTGFVSSTEVTEEKGGGCRPQEARSKIWKDPPRPKMLVMVYVVNRILISVWLEKLVPA